MHGSNKNARLKNTVSYVISPFVWVFTHLGHIHALGWPVGSLTWTSVRSPLLLLNILRHSYINVLIYRCKSFYVDLISNRCYSITRIYNKVLIFLSRRVFNSLNGKGRGETSKNLLTLIRSQCLNLFIRLVVIISS